VQYWANYMAGNPDAASGSQPNTDVATVANIMQSNASVGINDSIDKVYACAQDIKEKQAWYFHHDPWINIPISHRMNNGEQVQLRLTPEQRQGDFENLVFEIKARSMKASDPAVQAKKVLDFATNVLTNVTQSAMVLNQAGFEFNPVVCIKQVAELTGIDDDISGWFNDPQHDRRMMMLMQMGNKPSGKADGGQGGMQGAASPGGSNRNIPSQQTDMRAEFQQGANQRQSMDQGVR